MRDVHTAPTGIEQWNIDHHDRAEQGRESLPLYAGLRRYMYEKSREPHSLLKKIWDREDADILRWPRLLV